MKLKMIFNLSLVWISILGLNPSLSEARPLSPPSDVVYLSPEENQFYILINQFRSLLGLPQFEIHLFLQGAARKHSDWMASQDFLSHYGPTESKTPFQRMEEEGYANSTALGENVACGNSDPVKTFRQWAFSPGHLANMINPYFKHVGIARSGTGNEQCPFYWTNDFGSMSDPRKDPQPLTDLQKIRSAIEKVSGKIPVDTKVELPATSGSENPDEKKSYSLIQCMIPYALSKNVFSFTSGLDAILNISKNSFGNYQAKITYLKNGTATSYAPAYLNSVGVIQSEPSSSLLIHSAGLGKNSSFLIQLDLQKNMARFSSTQPLSPEVNEGLIYCSYKN